MQEGAILKKATNVHLKRFGYGLLAVTTTATLCSLTYGAFLMFVAYPVPCWASVAAVGFLAFVYWLGWVLTKPARPPDDGSWRGTY